MQMFSVLFNRTLVVLVFFAFLISENRVSAQCGPLTTLYAGNNGQDGIMFDITALQTVVITGFDIDAYGNTHDYEIYYKAGTHVGFQTNAAAWTLAGQAFSVPGNPRNSPTNIPIALSIPMCAGETYAFYLTSTSTSGSVSYTNGTAVGAVYSADANIQIKQGTGKDYPFNTSYTTRIPNITCYYNCAMSCCLPPTMSFTSESCSGACDGTATATVGAGGVAPYSYLWDAAAGNQTTQTATGLCAGTYNVDVTDNTGCVASGTITVTSGASSANATINLSGPFCENSLATNLTAADPGGTWSGVGITDGSLGTFDPAIAGVGTHTITYAISGACGDTDTEDFVVNASMDATITPVGPFCESDPALNLTAVDGGGTWSGNGITDAVNGTFNPSVAGSGTHTITYTIPGACGDIQTIDIAVNTQFDATIAASGPFCENDIATNLSAVDLGGTWSGTGITDASLGTFDPTVAGIGSYVITYTILGACGNTDTETIVVNANSDATINPAGPFCPTQPATNLSAASLGGTWSGTGITDINLGTFDPAVAGVGTHTITYTIGGACGDVQTINIVVSSNLNSTITAAGPFCESDAAYDLSAVDAGGSWSGTGITDISLGIFNPSVSGAGTFTINYVIPGVCGSSSTTSITVIADANATIIAAGPFCESDAAINLSAADAGGVWSGTGITDAALGTFDPAVAGIGTHTITYTIAGQCGDLQSISIVVDTQRDATITPAGPFCEDAAALNLSAVDPGGVWSGTGITDVNLGTFNPSVAGVGTYTITYTISGSCGDTQSTTITVNALDNATITPVGPICLGTTQTLSAVTGGGTWTGTGIVNASTGAFSASVAGQGIHTITYTTSGPCPDVSTTDIEVLGPLSVQAFNNTSICAGSSASLSALGSGGNGVLTYSWTDQAGNSVGTGTNITVSPLVTTTYTVEVIDGCGTPSQTDQVTVTVYPVPNISISASSSMGCIPLEVTFTNTSIPGGSNCSWNFGNGETSTNCGSAVATYTDGGCYDVSLTVTENGCTNSQTFPSFICVAEEPIAAFTANPIQTTELNPEVQFYNASQYATLYNWNLGDGTSTSETDPFHVYEQTPGSYEVCLIASNDLGCADTICNFYDVLEELIYYVPNTFTPDGNEFNQSWKPIFTSGFDPYDYTVLVFNRWGEVVWESNDATVGWDGTYSEGGLLVPSGVYTYQIEFKTTLTDERKSTTGHLSIMY